MSKARVWGVLLLAGLAILAACGGQDNPEEPDDALDMPNPASVYCEAQGGRLEFRQDSSGGTYGVCIFEDGTECEEWSYYRDQCKPGDMEEAPEPQGGSGSQLANPAAVHCEEKGGQVEMRQDSSGGTYGVCIFEDGSECDEWAFFRGECQPGEMDKAPEPGQ